MASYLSQWLESMHQRLAALFLMLVEKNYIPDFLLRCLVFPEHPKHPPPFPAIRPVPREMTHLALLQDRVSLPNCEDTC